MATLSEYLGKTTIDEVVELYNQDARGAGGLTPESSLVAMTAITAIAGRQAERAATQSRALTLWVIALSVLAVVIAVVSLVVRR